MGLGIGEDNLATRQITLLEQCALDLGVGSIVRRRSLGRGMKHDGHPDRPDALLM
jgi:hypothetical protein